MRRDGLDAKRLPASEWYPVVETLIVDRMGAFGALEAVEGWLGEAVPGVTPERIETPETWGTSPEAVRSQAAIMAAMGGPSQ